uniref:Uncharacterized protein n=1 Tax=Noccaea caerulescens TaxID=107243 RepID=A0A1J3FBD4_NOCCA
MEEYTDGKRKSAPSLPANYISILQLQERWIKEKERKRKEEERRRKQEAEEQQQRIEEDLKRAEVQGKREDLDEKRLNRNNRKHWDRNIKKKESIDGGEASCADKEETASIRSERGEDAAPRDEDLLDKNRGRRKRYDSNKKKKKDAAAAAAVKGDVVDECGSIAPPENVVTENHTPVKDAIRVNRKKGKKATGKKTVTDDATAIETKFENLSINRGETENVKAQTRLSNRNQPKQRHDLHPQCVAVEENVVECGTENHTPVKDGIRVYRKKGEKTKGKLSVGSREKAVADDDKVIDTQCENNSIERGESKNLKAQTRSRNRHYRLNQRHDLPPRHVRMHIGDATMVWVKKGQNERAGDGTGSGL